MIWIVPLHRAEKCHNLLDDAAKHLLTETPSGPALTKSLRSHVNKVLAALPQFSSVNHSKQKHMYGHFKLYARVFCNPQNGGFILIGHPGICTPKGEVSYKVWNGRTFQAIRDVIASGAKVFFIE